MGNGGCNAGGAASVMSEARAPKVALPARTAVGLREVRDTAMASGKEGTHKRVATQY